MADLSLAITASVPGSESATITIYEDVGDTGSIDNTGSASLLDGKNIYSISGFDFSTGNSYFWDLESSGDVTSGVEVDIVNIGAKTISGTVKLNGSGVQGAVVTAVNVNNNSVIDKTTTGVSGGYSLESPKGLTIHVIVQYDDGSDKYNALSKPYIQT